MSTILSPKLKNDGEGRCVIVEVPEYKGKDNEWLKSYGVRDGELEIDKQVVETQDWISEDMIEEGKLFRELISHEKEFTNYIKDFYIEIKPYYQRSIQSAFERVSEGDIGYFQEIQPEGYQVILIKEDSPDKFYNSPNELFSNYINKLNQGVSNKLMLKQDGGKSYLYYSEKEGVAVRGGQVYIQEEGLKLFSEESFCIRVLAW